ncbi:DUF4267 domain-containing protein [Martelella alba]|uniref:DUF4267 domain-containing protein n=1 Tax=Martelella alba TaxID=2590451 RepID=A0ABY2SDP7_9HYPH|nr:DUF4267 domain-containing protein [Martelella alba]TKI02206.1 DUF4267 domain-containing protein [Martelella alba]
MAWLALGMAALIAVAIIFIGLQYISAPAAAMRSFGLPLPEPGANTLWWLRLKGIRDIASGLTVLSMMVWGTSQMVGIILLAETLIPAGDGALVLASKGSAAKALGMHGVTALIMVLTSIALITGRF